MPTRIIPKGSTAVIAKPSFWGYDKHLGYDVWQYPVPNDMYHVVWWQTGPKPGSGGMAVILGHHQIGGYGVFNNLADLRPGDQVALSGDGIVLHYAYLGKKTGLSKDEAGALSGALDHPPAGADLAAVTCWGQVHGSSHDDNAAVYFHLLGATRA